MSTGYHDKERYGTLLMTSAGEEAAKDPVIKEKRVPS
jgi:hypothetical protein